LIHMKTAGACLSCQYLDAVVTHARTSAALGSVRLAAGKLRVGPESRNYRDNMLECCRRSSLTSPTAIK